MDEAETIDGDIWLAGNRTLISLNLSSKNHIYLIYCLHPTLGVFLEVYTYILGVNIRKYTRIRCIGRMLHL